MTVEQDPALEDQQDPAPLEDEQDPAPLEDDDQQEQPDPADEDPAGDEDEDDEDPDDGSTFDAGYVRRLRRRSAGYRTELRAASDNLEHTRRELFTARVQALGVLADPGDLDYSPELLEDPDALEAAARELVAKKPHYGRRAGLRDTGARDTPGGFDAGLMDLMRGA